MIAHLRGKLLAKHPNQAIVETGGVGYDVTISVWLFLICPRRRRSDVTYPSCA
jgi:Holliday junction DNA helicase RuvA